MSPKTKPSDTVLAGFGWSFLALISAIVFEIPFISLLVGLAILIFTKNPENLTNDFGKGLLIGTNILGYPLFAAAFYKWKIQNKPTTQRSTYLLTSLLLTVLWIVLLWGNFMAIQPL